METQSSQKQEEIDVRMNHFIQEILRAEIHFLKAKLRQLNYYRTKLIALRKLLHWKRKST